MKSVSYYAIVVATKALLAAALVITGSDAQTLPEQAAERVASNLAMARDRLQFDSVASFQSLGAGLERYTQVFLTDEVPLDARFSAYEKTGEFWIPDFRSTTASKQYVLASAAPKHALKPYPLQADELIGRSMAIALPAATGRFYRYTGAVLYFKDAGSAMLKHGSGETYQDTVEYRVSFGKLCLLEQSGENCYSAHSDSRGQVFFRQESGSLRGALWQLVYVQLGDMFSSGHAARARATAAEARRSWQAKIDIETRTKYKVTRSEALRGVVMQFGQIVFDSISRDFQQYSRSQNCLRWDGDECLEWDIE